MAEHFASSHSSQRCHQIGGGGHWRNILAPALSVRLRSSGYARAGSSSARHALPAPGAAWLTQRWVLRVFAFLLAVSEVNMFNAFRYFVWKKSDDDSGELALLKARRKLAMQLASNELLAGERGEALGPPLPEIGRAHV